MGYVVAMDKRVTIQVRVAGQDDIGAPSNNWENFVPGLDGKVWAAIEDLTGREYVAAGGTQNATTTKISIRPLAGIIAAMRVVHGVEIYNIEAILRHGPDLLVLMCSKGSNLG